MTDGPRWQLPIIPDLENSVFEICKDGVRFPGIRNCHCGARTLYPYDDNPLQARLICTDSFKRIEECQYAAH